MMRRALSVVLAATAIAGVMPLARAEAASVVRASCHQQGRIVYREDFPADAPAEKRILIAARNPGAMCVFLDVSDTGHAAARSEGAEYPADPSHSFAPDDPGLAAALSVIADGRIGERYPASIASAIPAPSDREAGKSASSVPSGFLNLTVGIYRNVALADVMDHWRMMQEGTSVLSRMTPTVSTVDGVIVVSVEGVPDDKAVGLCEEAARKGAGCVAVY